MMNLATLWCMYFIYLVHICIGDRLAEHCELLASCYGIGIWLARLVVSASG